MLVLSEAVLSEAVLSEAVLSEAVLVLDGCSNRGEYEYEYEYRFAEYEKKHEQCIAPHSPAGVFLVF
ncbi:MAG: hypothetical protein ACOYOZ_04390 [Pirellula sp.]